MLDHYLNKKQFMKITVKLRKEKSLCYFNLMELQYVVQEESANYSVEY